eukprot:RCo021135
MLASLCSWALLCAELALATHPEWGLGQTVAQSKPVRTAAPAVQPSPGPTALESSDAASADVNSGGSCKNSRPALDDIPPSLVSSLGSSDPRTAASPPAFPSPGNASPAWAPSSLDRRSPGTGLGWAAGSPGVSGTRPSPSLQASPLRASSTFPKVTGKWPETGPLPEASSAGKRGGLS